MKHTAISNTKREKEEKNPVRKLYVLAGMNRRIWK
jgi:hypothetical protein